ncbi:MAG: radical SAM protein [Candidatus Omnitrophica bacterium]|nr:radical SAM protein [Candidatus Omnitrophota bacterium]
MAEFNVLFIYPNLRGMNMLPPAIAIFSRILKDNDFNVALFDTTYYRVGEFDSDKEKEKNLQVRPFDMSGQVTLKTTDPLDDLDQLVRSCQPDLIALSATEDIFPGGLKLLKHIDKYNILTITGGVYPTFAPEKVISHKEVDIVCIGEGEEALLELCTRLRQGVDFSNIHNLWVKNKDGEIIRNPLKYLQDINNEQLPDFTLFEEARFYRPMAGKVYRMFPVETHRGCPYQCTYCNAPVQRKLYSDAGVGNFLRKKKIGLVKKELEFYRDKWKAEYFYFWAETFLTYTDSEFDEFIKMYKDIEIPFWCQTRPETVSEYRISKLKNVGLHRISIGIEHGNEEFRRKYIKRNITNDAIVEAINIIAECSLPAGISVNNIVGFPDETPELAMDTIELNRRIADKVDTMNCYAFVPYHGTGLHALSVKRGFINDDTPTSCLTGEPVLDMPQFPKERVKGIIRTFSLYVKFDKSRWPEIKMAQSYTPEGNRIFEGLRNEYVKKYFFK